MTATCKCGRGKVSAYDGKCGNCRSRREMERHKKLVELPGYDITVVNKHHGHGGFYIGRGSPLGNPFPIGPGCTRDQAVNQYEPWLNDKIAARDPLVCDALNRIADMAEAGPVRLQCFCAPQRCHGDVIRKVIIQALNRRGY